MKDYTDTSPDDVTDAMATLNWWLVNKPSDPCVQDFLSNISNRIYPQLRSEYDPDFQVGDNYRCSLPDIQNTDSASIRGTKTQIQWVGIDAFRIPLTFVCKDRQHVRLDAIVSGFVSLDADKRGINMSRIMRTFYRFAEMAMDFSTLSQVIKAYREDLDAEDARLQIKYAYPVVKKSLRSGLRGFQYYNVAMDLEHCGGVDSRVIHFQYVYSSTCPCSLELSEHSRRERGQLATPHSQRSFADLSLEIVGDDDFFIEDLIEHCRRAIPTETQVMVKREDEQAFAELNAANPVFVEDAVRNIWGELAKDDRIGDFRIFASHEESLHSHDAVSTLYRGERFGFDRLAPFTARHR